MASTITTGIPCYICTGIVKKKHTTNNLLNDEQKTKHTATPISEFIKKIIIQPSVQVKSSEIDDDDEDEKDSIELKNCLCCKSCLIKINNYEKAILTAEQIQTEILQIYKQKIEVTIKCEFDVRDGCGEHVVEVSAAASNNCNVKDSISDDSNGGDSGDDETKLNLKAENILFENVDGGVGIGDCDDVDDDDDDNNYVDGDIADDDDNDDHDFDADDNVKDKIRESLSSITTTTMAMTTEIIPHNISLNDGNNLLNKESKQKCLKSSNTVFGAGGGGGGGTDSSTLCIECNQIFHTKFELAEHAKLVHLKKKVNNEKNSKNNLVCDICGQKFKTKSSLRVHSRLHKVIANPHKCDICGKTFAQKGNLVRHIPIHTGEALYQCDKCGKPFTHYQSFVVHQKDHQGIREKKCSICGLQLRSSSHLTRHMRVHTGEKPYECSVCGQRFAQRYNMTVHINKAHQDKNVNAIVLNKTTTK